VHAVEVRVCLRGTNASFSGAALISGAPLFSGRTAFWKDEFEMKSIGKYQVIEELGSSPTGKTYRVRDAFRNREFAAKILEIVPGLSAEAKEQFCGHLAACAELTHRHIAKVQDLGEVEEGIFVASEWRPGVDLRGFMQENQDLPLDQKLAVIAQVAEGLGFAHSRGIPHGNLKPSNIFVDAARDVSILDFGSAKWLAALLDAGCRPEGLVAKYLAPEQVLGQPFDARSDIFALGLMLYELASGKYPFSADAGLIPREIVHSEPELLRKLDAQVPADLEELVARALKKDPEQRLQTAEEFASGLYLVAQQLRRLAVAAQAANPPSVEQAPVPPKVAANGPDSGIGQLAAALTPEPVISQPVPQSAIQSASAAQFEQSELRVGVPGEPPVRERPQDARPEPRPWTSRSYAAGQPLAPSPSANPLKQPGASTPVQNPPQPPAYEPPEPPAYQPPQSFLQPAQLPPAPVQPKASKTTKRALIAVVGLILAVGFVGSMISRQNLRGSQHKSHVVPPATPEPVAPVAKPQPTPPVSVQKAPKPGESGPDDLGNPTFSAKQTLNGPVRSYWESGRYAQALVLVNQVLASDPANEDAQTWRKKIREAQAAEAALK
jgi:serine/threonine protein kinase